MYSQAKNKIVLILIRGQLIWICTVSKQNISGFIVTRVETGSQAQIYIFDINHSKHILIYSFDYILDKACKIHTTAHINE